MSGGDAMKPAFSATLSNHITDLGAQQALVFDHVITNVGNTYSNFTGDFTAPQDGTYFFTATVMSHSGSYLETEMVRNGIPVMLLYSYDNSFEQGSGGVVLVLRAGDQVWVRHHGSEGDRVYGEHWSYFSGFLI